MLRKQPSLNDVEQLEEERARTIAFMDFIFLARGAAVLPDLARFLATQTCVLDRHAEERVFVLLVVGGKGVLVEQYQFRVIRAITMGRMVFRRKLR